MIGVVWFAVVIWVMAMAGALIARTSAQAVRLRDAVIWSGSAVILALGCVVASVAWERWSMAVGWAAAAVVSSRVSSVVWRKYEKAEIDELRRLGGAGQ